MIPGNGTDDGAVPVIVHSGDHPDERIECVIELAQTGERLVAMWCPEADRWRLPYEEPVSELRPSAVSMWADLSELFEA
jgi:hypothetical protein